mmetsp:Transcript_29982/g.89712  ORF Transcript_29982/g.89712 Transcript_29982/m.89712 type:complete len:450 (-) Transcript_29982:193-1542(-)
MRSTRVVGVAIAVWAVGQVSANRTSTWLDKRNAFIGAVYGNGAGVLPTKAVPDNILTWPENPGLQGLVWNMSTFFEITSTVFYAPITSGKKTKSAVLFHHGHSNCICPRGHSDPPIVGAKCRPGCNSSMPTEAQLHEHGYSWWDLYNVSTFFHSLGHDVFILSMPLKGINLGPGSTATELNTDHWWFLQWEQKGDHPLRYFLEPAYLTVNYAVAQGYEDIYMAGLSGGGWSTTFAAAIDKRIKASFPIAGSTPCAMRNPTGLFPGQVWTGSDREDYEQNCLQPDAKTSQPGRAAFQACNYTCQYLLAGLEPSRFQVQILHEYDTCCFSPHGRHNQMLRYEANIQAELMADDRSSTGHGWFTSTADNHSKHEVAAQDKAIIRHALAAELAPGDPGWSSIPCDILHQPLPANCAPDVEDGLPPGYIPMCPDAKDAAKKIPCGPAHVTHIRT